MFLEELLAHADRLRRDLHQLIVIDEFQRLFQAHLHRGRQQHVFVAAGGTDVGQLLALEDVDDQIVVTRVDTDDLAFIHLVARLGHHAAAILQVEQRIGQRLALLIGDQHTVVAITDVRVSLGPEVVEVVGEQAGARGHGHELGLEADQAT